VTTEPPTHCGDTVQSAGRIQRLQPGSSESPGRRSALQSFRRATHRHDATITVLMDDESSDGDLHSEHGLSLWIEYADRRILFDTGQSPLLLRNAEAMGIDLATTGIIVLSHGHYDHTGGLAAIAEVAPKAVIYVHPAATGPKYSVSGGTFRSISMPDDARDVILRGTRSGRSVWTEGSTEIASGIAVTGRVPRHSSFEEIDGAFYVDRHCKEPDLLVDDQACFLDCHKGLVVLLGCAHAGVINCLDYISDLTGRRRIHAVIGGLHLMRASAEQIAATTRRLEEYGIRLIMPAHCTGQKAVSKIQDTFADCCVVSGVGRQISI